MISIFKQDGEPFGDEELGEAFGYLVGKSLYNQALPKDFITAEEFASDLLGFEEYEEGDEEVDAAEAGGYDAMPEANKVGMPINEVIPEEEGF